MAENGQVPWNRTKVPLLLCQPAKHNKTAFSLPRTNIIIFWIITADKYNLIQSRNNNPFPFLSSIYQVWLGNWKIMQPGLIVRVKITHHQKKILHVFLFFFINVNEQKRKPTVLTTLLLRADNSIFFHCKTWRWLLLAFGNKNVFSRQDISLFQFLRPLLYNFQTRCFGNEEPSLVIWTKEKKLKTAMFLKCNLSERCCENGVASCNVAFKRRRKLFAKEQINNKQDKINDKLVFW